VISHQILQPESTLYILLGIVRNLRSEMVFQ
jgi:hypothetical protein